MKKNLFCLLAVVCTMCLMTACSDDKEEPFVVPSKPVTYTTGNGLSLKIDDNSLQNATATFNPDAANPDKGTIVIKNNGSSKGVTPGENDIIPGTAVLTIPVELNATEAGATFSGQSETEYYTYSYQGTMRNHEMRISIFDLASKNLHRPDAAMIFTDLNGLTLTYNGTPLIGKMVTFTPDAADNTKAVLTLEGAPLDITSILGRANEAGFATAGVLPGSPKTDLNVTLTSDLTESTFNGTGETEYCTFAYSGVLTNKTMKLDLTEVKLKNTSLAGTVWVPTEEHPNEMGMVEGSIYVNWVSDATFDPGFPPQMFVTMVCSMGLIPMPTPENPDKVIDLNQALAMFLQKVRFTEDGNIIADYLDEETMAPATSPAGIAQYVVTDNNSILLFLNPAAIAADANKSKADEGENDMITELLGRIDMEQLINLAMTQYLPMLSNGVPVHFNASADNGMNIYVDTDFLLPMLKIAAPAFEDKEFVDAFVAKMLEGTDLGMSGAMASGVFKSIPAVVEGTSTIELGLSLTKAE